uniref:Uncharacterized protein n=1 Tax=Tetradesmus obliquus TaxID=3088 RepID=A0A383WA48_TETOB
MRKALSGVRRRSEKLQEENERLAYQHQLITEMCKGFEWFRNMQLHALLAGPEQLLGDDVSEQLTPGCMQLQFTSLLETEAEVQLLQQLSSLPVTQQSSSTGAAAPAASALDSGQGSSNAASPASSSNQLVAPPGDLLWLLKQVCRQPWPQGCPSADEMTVAALIDNVKATASALSILLVQFDACTDAAEQAELSCKLQGTLMQHFRVGLEFTGCSHRAHPIRTLQLTNCDTGEQLKELNMQRTAWVTDSLQLSQQQQRNIAQGSVLAQKLLTPALAELRELQLQQGGESEGRTCDLAAAADGCNDAAGAAASSNQPGKGSAADAGSCSNASAAAAVVAAAAAGAAAVAAADDEDAAGAEQDTAYHLARRHSLLQQEQRSARMKLLMGKVLMYPFYPVPNDIFAHVAAKVSLQQQ